MFTISCFSFRREKEKRNAALFSFQDFFYFYFIYLATGGSKIICNQAAQLDIVLLLASLGLAAGEI